jgi:hypothetical protein
MLYGYDSHAYHNGNDDKYSPFTYQNDSPLFIPTYNNHQHSTPPETPTSYTQEVSGNYLGNYLGNYCRDSPSPESEAGYNEELMRRMAEYRLTPQELQEANEACIRKQNEWLVTRYGADRRDHEREETRGKQREDEERREDEA